MPPKGDVVTDNELQLSSSLSGLSLLSRTNELSTWNDQPARVYRIRASVDEVSFDMVLIAVEQIHGHSSIADLQITVHGIWQYELDPLVKQCEEAKEPTMFLLGLRSFVNEMEYRRDVWKWMKAKWGSYVSFPVESYSDSVLVCTDKDASPSDRPKFLLTWVIQFSPEGIVVPVIRPFFDIQMKEDAKQSECDQLIRSILSVFDELIHVRSVEDAICFLMEC
ncbi:hypothetical protein WA538_002832, partial [Blastocystis sp. DL]